EAPRPAPRSRASTPSAVEPKRSEAPRARVPRPPRLPRRGASAGVSRRRRRGFQLQLHVAARDREHLALDGVDVPLPVELAGPLEGALTGRLVQLAAVQQSDDPAGVVPDVERPGQGSRAARAGASCAPRPWPVSPGRTASAGSGGWSAARKAGESGNR